MSFLASAGGRASGYSHFIQLTRLDDYWRLSRRFGEKKSLHIVWAITYFIIFLCVYLGIRFLERVQDFSKNLGATTKFQAPGR